MLFVNLFFLPQVTFLTTGVGNSVTGANDGIAGIVVDLFPPLCRWRRWKFMVNVIFEPL